MTNDAREMLELADGVVREMYSVLTTEWDRECLRQKVLSALRAASERLATGTGERAALIARADKYLNTGSGEYASDIMRDMAEFIRRPASPMKTHMAERESDGVDKARAWDAVIDTRRDEREKCAAPASPIGADVREALERVRDLLRDLLREKKLGVRYAAANQICHQISAALAAIPAQETKR